MSTRGKRGGIGWLLAKSVFSRRIGNSRKRFRWVDTHGVREGLVWRFGELEESRGRATLLLAGRAIVSSASELWRPSRSARLDGRQCHCPPRLQMW
jgi:hypothetical protein